ncbi:galactose-binding domain-like protein [Russula aff. rugulosa BPL654]|nr:galactose-binding domain-like protein [Russula aff. rugulosa BPL654]
MLTRLITTDTRIKVSSTLDNSLGKSCLVDGNPETCWTSQQGLPQYIQLVFPSPVIPGRISLTFQGGFVGTACIVNTRSQDATTWQELTRIYPEDVNRAQVFDLTLGEPVKTIKLIFEESSDFFGRITVYNLMIEGQISSDELEGTRN